MHAPLPTPSCAYSSAWFEELGVAILPTPRPGQQEQIARQNKAFLREF
jgi:hypothetical protein